MTAEHTAQEKERWWGQIISHEPKLATHEAKTQIQAALTRYRNAKTARTTYRKARKGKSPWAFDKEDCARMKRRVEELKQDLQPYLPKGVKVSGNRLVLEVDQKLGQIVANLDAVAAHLDSNLAFLSSHTKRGGRERETDLQWLVYELGLIREQITEKKLDGKKPSRRYIHDCLWGLEMVAKEVKQETIDVAITYVYYHPDEFSPLLLWNRSVE